ncbi:hypothetical protein O3P69_001550 [Scylla paramamosain]|uniref:Uncharacterized protein n=1 Tax=Scylla paramamosain TaxID=85552 RepID=A0AAW0V2F9_SCYPA
MVVVVVVVQASQGSLALVAAHRRTLSAASFVTPSAPAPPSPLFSPLIIMSSSLSTCALGWVEVVELQVEVMCAALCGGAAPPLLHYLSSLHFTNRPSSSTYISIPARFCSQAGNVGAVLYVMQLGFVVVVVVVVMVVPEACLVDSQGYPHTLPFLHPTVSPRQVNTSGGQRLQVVVGGFWLVCPYHSPKPLLHPLHPESPAAGVKGVRGEGREGRTQRLQSPGEAETLACNNWPRYLACRGPIVVVVVVVVVVVAAPDSAASMTCPPPSPSPTPSTPHNHTLLITVTGPLKRRCPRRRRH